MRKHQTVRDILKVAISNVLILLSGVLVGFLLPKIIGVTEYGFYKTYTLYAVYVGMFHFGISDGIYLKYGGVNYSDLDRSKFRYYTACFMKIELALSVILALISQMFFSGEYKFIFLFLAIYLFFHNATNLFQVVSQVTSRFNELSKRNILQSIFISALVVILWGGNYFFQNEIGYRTYVVFYSVVVVTMACWYVYTYKDIAFGKIKKHDRDYREIIGFIAAGFPLMLANLCVSLILTLDRQFVNILFDMDSYAIYAFAYNMLALVTTATSAISMVIYPKLKQMDLNIMKNHYTSLVSVMLCLVFASLCIFFPLNLFVNWYLPKFSSSLLIFRIIFPGLAASSAIMIVMHNYYKALGKTNNYFLKSVITLIVSVVANLIAYELFNTMAAISIASIITMVFWYLFVEHYFIKTFHVEWMANFAYMISMMGVFYLVTMIYNQLLSLLIYLIAYAAVTFMFFYKKILKRTIF